MNFASIAVPAFAFVALGGSSGYPDASTGLDVSFEFFEGVYGRAIQDDHTASTASATSAFEQAMAGARTADPPKDGGFKQVSFLIPYANYLHRAVIAWAFCMGVMVATSLLTSPPPPGKTTGIIWSWRYAALPRAEQEKYTGWRDLRLWWLIFIGAVLSIYGFFLWFRFQHPDMP